MKVILNEDVPNLGELGDVKVVANGYARNFLLPRGLVFPYSKRYVAMFENRKAEIEQIKAKKRQESADLKTKLEAEEIVLEMSAGASGKLFGAVSNATVAEELIKRGYQIDRKKIEIQDRIIKSVGNYKVIIHLYEKEEAVIHITIKGIVEKAKTAEKPANGRKPRAEKPVVEEAQAPAAATEAAETESEAK